MRHLDLNRPAHAHNPFVVPDGYFDRFSNIMMQRIKRAEKPVPDLPVVRWIPMLGAACVALLVVLFTQYVPMSGMPAENTNTTAAQTHSTDEEAAYDYLIMANTENLTSYANDY